jgi:hypothetical protein
MTSLLLPSLFIPSLLDKQRRVLKYRGKETPSNCDRASPCCRITANGRVRSDHLPAVLTPGERLDVTMWRRNSWVHLICVVTLLSNLALTAATTGE